MSQVLHVPYTVEQVEGGAWRAHAQLLPEAEANGQGSTREEAIADLREALTGLIVEFGAPEEMILTLDVGRCLAATSAKAAKLVERVVTLEILAPSAA